MGYYMRQDRSLTLEDASPTLISEDTKMTIPGFTAETSIFRPGDRYNTTLERSLSSNSGSIVPARPMIDICNHYCDTHGQPLSCYEWCDKTWGGLPGSPY